MMSYSLFDTDTFSMCCEARSWCLRVEIKGQKKKKNEINEKIVQKLHYVLCCCRSGFGW